MELIRLIVLNLQCVLDSQTELWDLQPGKLVLTRRLFHFYRTPCSCKHKVGSCVSPFIKCEAGSIISPMHAHTAGSLVGVQLNCESAS